MVYLPALVVKSAIYLFTLLSSSEITGAHRISKTGLNLTNWEIYVKTFSKFYDDLSEDNEFRRNIFDKNVRAIQKWNMEYKQGLHSYKQGINPFTAKTTEEMNKMGGIARKREESTEESSHEHWNFTDFNDNDDEDEKKDRLGDTHLMYRRRITIPSEFDWRESGIIPEVKYQADCASCYAFTVLDTIEARFNMIYGESETLSAQMLVDCSKENDGCKGGYLDKSFEYLLRIGGVATEEEYPYRAKVGQCRIDEFELGYTIESLVYLPSGDEKGLKKLLVLSGPIAVSLDSEPAAFQKYEGGIFDDPTCKTTNLFHTGLLVGYGKENGTPYWTVKNSWSEWWGEDGYIRIRRNNNNRCGIASNAIYPII